MEGTMSYGTNRTGGKGFLIVTLLIAATLLLATVVVPAIEQTSNHAVEVHGADAVRVQDWCNRNGVIQFWMEPDRKTVHQLCPSDDGKRIGDWIVVKDEGQVFEKTRFIPKNGNLSKIINWLVKKGATKVVNPWR